MQFTLNEIKEMADSGTFARGFNYFRERRVIYVDYGAAPNVLMAEVSGSGKNRYVVKLFDNPRGLEALCTCPVDYNCKHGVAAALQWLQLTSHHRKGQTRPPVRSPLEQWLARLPSANSDEADPLTHGHHYLLYFLSTAQQQVSLSIKKGYLKQNGDWSQLKSYTPSGAWLGWDRPTFFRDDDITILQLLSGPVSGRSHYNLTDESGRLALMHLLASSRLYLDRQPVSRGEPRSLQWTWQDNGNTRQLGGQLHGIDNWQLINVTPPCYLDTDNAEVGDLASPLGSAQIQHLLEMPAVPQQEMSTIALQLRRAIPADHLPLPVEPQLETVTRFTPRLTLASCRLPDGATLPCLLLDFDYGGFALEPLLYRTDSPEPIDRQRDGTHYQIQRDISAEDAACDLAHEQGLFLCDELGDRTKIWIPGGDSAAETFTRWQQIVDQKLPALAQKGWLIETDPDYQFTVRQADFSFELRDAANHWFDFSLQLPLADGRQLDTAALIESWLENNTPDEFVVNVAGEWINIDARPLQGIRSLLSELVNRKALDKPVRLPAFQAAQLQDLPDLDSRQAPLTNQLIQSLNDFSGLKNVAAPAALHADLRGYQQQGLNWLSFLQDYGFGGILADDMGLGKTLQVLALIQHLKNNGQLKKPALIVVPTSLTGNWLHEAARFTPSLTVTLIHGPDRAERFKQINKSDLVITTYPLLLRDQARYEKRKFSLMVLDEAQAIKNPTTKIAASVRAIHSANRLCLTGTPLENHLGELWALMDFALPGLLGGRKAFNDHFRTPIEKDNDSAQRQALARKVAPFMLRRTKNAVVRELPPKTEMVQYVDLEGKQRALYESIRLSMEKRIRDLVAKQGMARSHIAFLDALLKLRQACIDPRLVKLDKAANIKESAKLEWLADTLPQLLEEGRNILIFSQFTEVLKLIEAQLKALKLDYSKLTGATRKRQPVIDRFQNGEVRIFLISLKAGGAGLNLTAADVVIHMDPWWNPAVENQATDRAHRIGQDKPVFVYKLVAADTVEERIQQMQQQKQALADALFDATGTAGLPADKGDLLALLSE